MYFPFDKKLKFNQSYSFPINMSLPLLQAHGHAHTHIIEGHNRGAGGERDDDDIFVNFDVLICNLKQNIEDECKGSLELLRLIE